MTRTAIFKNTVFEQAQEQALHAQEQERQAEEQNAQVHEM